MRRLVRSLLVPVLLTCGCDDGAAKKQAAEAEAKAAKEKAEQEKTDAAIAKRKAEREAEAKAKAEEEERRRTEMARLCVIPDPPPKKSPSCEEVGEAHDAFIRRVGDPETVTKWDGGDKESELPMTIVRCTQADSNKVAICQHNALSGAGAEFLGYEKDLLQRCIDQFGKAGGNPGMVPPKPGG